MAASERRKWWALALLSAVQFMVVLDIAVVNVALPSIKVDLGFSEENLQWVISAYALVFGGFLLLGGRAADLLGRRRLFLAGVIVFTAGLVLLVAFVAWERRHAEPLMRFGLLRIRTVSGANVSGFILGTAIFSMFLMLTLYMQQVLGYSAMKTGVSYLAVAGTAIVWSSVAAQLVTRVGVKPILVVGMTALTAGLLYFTQVSVGGSYVGDLLPGFLLISVGIGFSFVPISIAALAGVDASEAGLASGLINTSQQVGGALGIAALSTIATSRTEDALGGGSTQAAPLGSGFHGAFPARVILARV